MAIDQVSFQNGFVCGMATRGLVRSREYASAGSMVIGYPADLYKQGAISGLYTSVVTGTAVQL